MGDPNVFSPQWQPGTPPGVKGQMVGAAAGATELGATVYELEPGVAVSPYHLHHGNEELLIVLSGRVRLRTPDGERELDAGAVVAFPRGADGAHRVAAGPEEPARVLLVSTMNFPEIAEHLSTGTTLTMSSPGVGKAFSADGEVPFLEAYAAAIERDTSTS
ncbi:cupin domain-containing protein [Solirubrobacter sp. CPCC 204708]|uniref:Cupin domain-containing protein n=1 Tax=Solirubrobacter deserti TaxID=2282478 RepID=A0ABT4RSV2_9ACTN|nr:cupin domain-containing protein [Solirubrobacter deserti]MBE2316390.1 cupin domain-containing protein [Solirubrobacter deserti]MDA0141530.1 cupin domain-containing protein [Solirubrobacter deserti]